MTHSTTPNPTETDRTDDTGNPGDTPEVLQADDPRLGLAMVVESVGRLIESVEAMEPEVLTGRTPCPDYTVADLLDHLMMVMRRVAVIGNGGHFSTVQQEALGSGWGEAYRSAADEIRDAWTDSNKLGQMFEVPWGGFPGAPLLMAYTGELAVHGWDLATATGQEFHVADEILQGPLVGAKFIPAEGRGTPEVPFGPVVDPGPDATVLEQLAGWMGRQVTAA